MLVRSIGWRTDLHLRVLEGARVEDRGDHLVVANAHNPTYRWANFLLLADAAGARDAGRCLELFHRELPAAGHVAIGLDDPAATPRDLAALCAHGLQLEQDAVLVAEALRRPRPAQERASIRPLDGDADWEAALAMEVAVDAEDGKEEAGYREYLALKQRAVRDVCERGHGAWFGAFQGDRMAAGLGIFDCGDGVARYQRVATRPEHRRRGLAGNLLAAAAAWARAELSSRLLVIAADPGYFAIGLYRSLGFREQVRQLRVEARRLPLGTQAPS